MSGIPSNLTRTSNGLAAQLLLASLQQTQVQMLQVQTQLSTGKRINNPSDDPGAIGSLTNLRTILAQFTTQNASLATASNMNGATDTAMADLTNLLTQAQNVASSEAGTLADPSERSAQASVVSSLIDSFVQILNRQNNGVYLFSGQNSNQPALSPSYTGYQYTGSAQPLSVQITPQMSVALNSSAGQVLGMTSGRVQGNVDLDPKASAATRLADVNGARNGGVTLGTVQLNVDGTLVNVDLAHADNLGDVRDRINAAIANVDPTAGSVAVTSTGFSLTAATGHTIGIGDIGEGKTAADLGLNLTGITGATAAGADLNPKLTLTTNVADFGPSVDLTSGLKVSVNGNPTVINFAGCTTAQDMINAVSAAGVGLRMSINDAGTGFNLTSDLSGVDISVGENAGGTTATDLGLRSYDRSTLLSDFNSGAGVTPLGNGQDDLAIQLHDGSAVNVSLSAAVTLGDVIDAINTAGGGNVTAALASDGNGLVLTDTTSGASDFSVGPAGSSTAATSLGLVQDAGSGSTITAPDNAPIYTDSALSHLIALRDALLSNDVAGITLAGQQLQKDMQSVAQARAVVGVQANQIQNEQSTLSNRNVQTQSLLSDLQDTDVTAAISRFTQLQQQLQASLQVGVLSMNLTLLDFLK